MNHFTVAERKYLQSQRLGRLATTSADGGIQNNPVGFFVNDELGTIDIGGMRMGATRKFRNVRETGRAAFVVDDLESVDPWRVRGVEVRGRAEALTDVRPPGQGYSTEIIRIYPEQVISWGLDPGQQRPNSRRVDAA
jgi:pyridoxamine 5'-phosphate oxidase family protein